MSPSSTSFRFDVTPEQAGMRLDVVVASAIDGCSRSFAATLIRQKQVQVDGRARKAGYLLKTGQKVCGDIPAPQRPPIFQPEAIPLSILYEDSDLVVINKAPGMVVHPAPGNESGTVANAVAHHCPDLAAISGSLRPGIVHRLDKETSGALVVAKNSRAMHYLADQFKSRAVSKIYQALVYGTPTAECGTVEWPIGRHPVDRKRMSVRSHRPRTAITHWAVREYFGGVTLLEIDIRTGRTHQIRVHCQAMGHPLVGDPVYTRKGSLKQLAGISKQMADAAKSVHRQMLHAWKLSFIHPDTEKRMTQQAPLPEEMVGLIDRFRALRKEAMV